MRPNFLGRPIQRRKVYYSIIGWLVMTALGALAVATIVSLLLVSILWRVTDPLKEIGWTKKSSSDSTGSK